MADNKLFKLIAECEAKFVDFRFTDTHGRERHISFPAATIGEEVLTEGRMFDGSSLAGWKSIDNSDMILMPDPETAVLDPFFDEPTIIVRCDVIEPSTLKPYSRDPRGIAKRALAHLKSTGIADNCYFGPEPEFFLFDSVRWGSDMSHSFYQIDSEEGFWNSKRDVEGGNRGYRPGIKGGYFSLPPQDSSQDIRSAICLILQEMGLPVEAHHHEVATANQNEVVTRFNSLCLKADEIQILKYVVRNVAQAYGKTATFMPKPLVGDNGSGMHCHQSLFLGGKNLFAGDRYAQLSELGLYYIGGIIRHAHAINAFTNPSTNSYKRLVPGFEAPVMLAYSSRNRSAAIRIPYASAPEKRRIEVRFPDSCSNPYLGFTAMMMAGIDGIAKKIHPGDPIDKDLYELPPEETRDIPTVCASLREAMNALDVDRAFLVEGGVFTDEIIDSYIQLKLTESERISLTPHPVEFELYYGA